MAGGNANLYPAGNAFPTLASLMAQFENAAAGDYRLIATSSLRSMPQGVPGVDFGELQQTTSGPTGPAPGTPTGLRVVD